MSRAIGSECVVGPGLDGLRHFRRKVYDTGLPASTPLASVYRSIDIVQGSIRFISCEAGKRDITRVYSSQFRVTRLPSSADDVAGITTSLWGVFQVRPAQHLDQSFRLEQWRKCPACHSASEAYVFATLNSLRGKRKYDTY